MITQIAITHFTKSQFFEFMQSIQKIVSEKSSTSGILIPMNTTFEMLQKSYHKEKQNEETANIVALDVRRDRAYLYIYHTIDATKYADRMPEKMEASKKLMAIAKEFGSAGLTKFEYNSETASITNFIDTCKKEQQSAIDTLELQADFEYLNKCNEMFIETYKKRGDATKEIGKITPFRIVRKNMEAIYNKLCQNIESLPSILPDTKDEVDDLIARLNVEIDSYQKMLNRKNGSKNTTKDDTLEN